MTKTVLAFYCITPIENPKEEVVRHHEFFRTRDIRSRIYISEEGINGQMSASSEHAEEYIAWMHADSRFAKIPFKLHEWPEHPFPKTTVKVRKNLVAFGCPTDLTQRGAHLSPTEWRKKLEERTEQTLVLDVRNNYEWDVGHFEGAERPACETSRDFPAYTQQLAQTRDPQKTRVLMYCTGGIRCEYYSSHLMKAGFSEVYQLEGGVIQYGFDEGSSNWRGKLFVFDDRLVTPISPEETPAVGHCRHCSTASEVYYNCANTDCNELYLCCPNCLHKFRGCCCENCITQPRVRTYRTDGTARPFRKGEC